ncbi:MAG TPA: EpsI family protein [Myxococcota bacterium]|nr:EpsI family protein [Myxococcota bacterium]
MRHAGSLLLVLLGLSVPLASFGVARSRASAVHAFDSEHIPAALGGFQLDHTDTLPSDVVEMLAPNTYTLRLYTRPDSDPIWAYVAFYDGVGNRPHDPTVCYPAQGWDVVGLRDRALPLPGGEELLGHFLRATQGPSEELVLYWFQPPERWPASAKLEPWLRALDGLAGRSRYAFIRLSTRVTAPESAAVDKAEGELSALARELAAPVRAAVRGS